MTFVPFLHADSVIILENNKIITYFLVQVSLLRFSKNKLYKFQLCKQNKQGWKHIAVAKLIIRLFEPKKTGQAGGVVFCLL